MLAIAIFLQFLMPAPIFAFLKMPQLSYQYCREFYVSPLRYSGDYDV